MAYSRYDSDKQVPYMDGIPVKISEQYKPPKKITLPSAILNKLNPETVLPEYDFTLERSVMDKMSEWRQLRSSQREARRERIEADRQARAASKPEEKPAPTERPASPPASRPYPILTPVPINASTHPQSTVYSRSFNISEFEQDTASPFDNMELKTINDLEELADILQPTVISDKDDNKSPPPRLNGLSDPYGYNGAVQWTSDRSQVGGGGGGTYPGWYREPHPVSGQYHPPHNPTIRSYVVQRLDVDRSSRSVPDLMQQLETELRDKREAETRRSTEQPQRPASIGPAEMSRKPVPAPETTRLSPPPTTTTTTTTTPVSVSSLPNPYHQLSPTCQQLTDRLAEMGFPLARVARAAESFGDDETRIVEFLVQVQRLEEMNHQADRAERALVANEYREAETVTYLRVLGQLLDLGFPEDKVERALKDCDSDRDKALDLLIS